VSLFEPLSPLVAWMLENSYAGLAAVMFLAGSVAPIPWELVLLPAGALGLDPLTAGLAGGLGASAGAVLGYWLGYAAGRPMVVGLGTYVMVSDGDLAGAEGWLARWGDSATLITRSVQYMPYKTFSLAAGVLRVRFGRYLVLTVVGTVVRCWYMVYLGNVAALSPSFLGFLALVFLVGFALPRLLRAGRGV
jgi:membrane protein DedA with SNARE-associated domain